MTAKIPIGTKVKWEENSGIVIYEEPSKNSLPILDTKHKSGVVVADEDKKCTTSFTPVKQKDEKLYTCELTIDLKYETRSTCRIFWDWVKSFF